jgi:methyltransferase (TIGR00027 family)
LKNQSWKTAFVAASGRLLEQYQPKEIRLFDDPVIKIFFSKLTLFQMQFKIVRDMQIMMSDFMTKGALGTLLGRTKYIDDLLESAISNHIDQVVILGAGLDTRPYRFSNSNHIKIIEVDLPIMQNIKKEKIQKHLGALPTNVTFIPIDFNSQTLDQVLTSKELDFSRPIFFIWEGVTQYITDEAVKNTLKFISRASSGSMVVFSYVLKNIIDKKSNPLETDTMLDYFESKNQSWIFGLDPLSINDFINQFDLTLVEDIGASYYQENYLKPLKRSLAVSEYERIVYAKIVNK